MTETNHGTLSVVIPTYNCRPLLDRHLKHLQTWMDLAYEIIVVDSQSNDGTRTYLEEKIKHPRLQFIDRDRGLYESWNAGISASSGDWIYLSTIGDTIEREHLIKMLKQGTLAKADVVISPCRFVDEEGNSLPRTKRGNPAILRNWGGSSFSLKPPAAKYHAYSGAGIQSLLGSCASDIFRGDFLRSRPFPTNYHTHGDVAWTLRHAHEMRLCVVPEIGSTFCRHPKSEITPKEISLETYDLMYNREITSEPYTRYFKLCQRLRLLNQERKKHRNCSNVFQRTLKYLHCRWLKIKIWWQRKQELKQLGEYRQDLV